MLLAIILRAMAILAASEPVHIPVNDELAASIAAAVEGEPDAERWAVRATVSAYYESRLGWHWNGRALEYNDCRSGDGGKSWGFFQIQKPVPKAVACASADAARIWLHMAKTSLKACGTLAQLFSGSCDRGTRVAAWRERETDRVMREVSR
jgi:hypothetical protein